MALESREGTRGGEGERVLALESREGTRASRRIDSSPPGFPIPGILQACAPCGSELRSCLRVQPRD